MMVINMTFAEKFGSIEEYNKEKEEKKLKRIVDGTETVIVMKWNYLKYTEYPSWRE